MSKRVILQAFGVVLAALFVISARAALAARSELAMGDEVIEQGDVDGALIHWRRAAKWHVPTSPYSRDALSRMENLAHDCESEGDVEGALRAWRAVRGSLFAARSFAIPGGDMRARADDRIAVLSQGETTQMEALLRRDGAPSAPFFLALLGFFLFCCGVVLLSTKAIDAEDRVIRASAGRYGALTLGGLILTIVSLAL